ncbi:MAG: hypothetical protein J6X42_00820 [Alphaproteobacteria bacterium]|nr:hypothetical protein [Alphaproteobacteria bacterium]
MQDLTDFQVRSLNKAFAEDASKSTSLLGTFGAMHRGQKLARNLSGYKKTNRLKGDSQIIQIT